MTLGVSIYVVPPETSFRIVLGRLAESLNELGWSFKSAYSSPGGSFVECTTESLQEVLDRLPTVATLTKNGRWLELSAGELATNVVDLRTDGSFFRGHSYQAELKNLFQKLRLPNGSVTVGHFDEWLEADLEKYSVDGLLSRDRLLERGIYWIDQFNSTQSKTLYRAYPALREKVLASIGDSDVVIVVDDPYEKEGQVFDTLRPIGAKLASDE